MGYELWKHIPKEFQEKLTNIRQEHLPANSGGKTAPLNIDKECKKVNFQPNTQHQN